MRKIYRLLTIIIALAAITSCEKEDGIKIKTNPDAQQILTPTDGSLVTLLKAEAGNPVTFTWNNADFGFDASVTYIVQLDAAGSNFHEAINVGSVQSLLTLSISEGQLNNKLIDAGYAPEVENSMDLRIAAIVNSHVDTLFSSISSIKIVPYSTVIIIPPIYLLGDGSQAGWDYNTNIELKYSETESAFVTYDSLKGTGYIKFIGNRGAWAPQWGTDGTGTSTGGPLVYRPTESVPDPSAIPAPAAVGMYKILADTAALTYEVSAYNVGLIGSATPNAWNSPDSKMSYDNANNIWTITVDLIVGEIKFRMNDAWDWNLGGDINDLTKDGANIPVAEAGNYTITLDLSKTPYKCVITKN